jgi:hypothetical protein
MPITGKNFNERIRRVTGVSEVMTKGVRWWRGVGLLASAPERGWSREQMGAPES